MKKQISKKVFAFIIMMMFSFTFVNAQLNESPDSREIIKAYPSKIMQIPKVDTSKPLPFKNNSVGSQFFTEQREIIGKRRITPEVDLITHPEENNNANMRVHNCPTPPVVQTNFEGNPQSQLYLFPYYGPSSCNIAISNAGKIVSISATWIRYYDENGILIFSDSLYNFGNGLIDCHVLYDPKADRFVFSASYGYYNADPFILDLYGTLIGFSNSNDPMDGWNLYQLPPTDFNDNSYGDYPLLAISDSEVFITLNYYKGNKYKHVEITQINKSDGYAGAASLSLQQYDAPLLGSTKGTMVPAQGGSTTYGPNMYFIMSNESGNSSKKYYVYEITNTLASGQAVLNRYGTVSSNISYFGSGVSYQPGGIILFDPNAPHQDYLQNAFYENGLIQFCQHTKANGKAAVNIGRISGIPNNLHCTAKTISDANLYLQFPSIVYAGNSSCDNSAIVGIQHTGANTYPGLSAAFVNSAFDVSSLAIVKAGNDTINGLWGNYSGICRRYNQTDEIWFEGQYGSTSDKKTNWIAKLQSPAPCSSRIASEKFVNDLIITPNPISTSASISFSLEQSEKVSIKIYDITGRMVKTLADAEMQEGVQQIEWNATDEKGNAVNAGIYFLKLETGNYLETKKLSVAR